MAALRRPAPTHMSSVAFVGIATDALGVQHRVFQHPEVFSETGMQISAYNPRVVVGYASLAFTGVNADHKRLRWWIKSTSVCKCKGCPCKALVL